MWPLAATLLISLLCPAVTNARFSNRDAFQAHSAKRGLVYIPNATYPNDYKIWIQNGSDLTWYYNYEYYPSAVYENSKLEFVPMLWGAPSSSSDTTFLSNVTAQIAGGANINYVMSFNEPDGTSSTGGSVISPALAASTWKREIEPLRKLNITLGAPAVTGGSTGWTWLQEFFTACDGGCSADFLPVHWYGNFDGLASHLGEISSTYPNMTIWVTEWALPDSNLADTQDMFNTSCEYFDRLQFDYGQADNGRNLTRYSYFGSFRSSVSNVGVNASMLTSNGSLTDIGAWYLDEKATGAIPDAVTVAGIHPSATSTYVMPALVTHYSSADIMRPGLGHREVGIMAGGAAVLVALV